MSVNDSVDTAVSASAGTGTRTSGRPLQQRAQVTKDAIIEAAASQFNTVGYAASSVNEIVAQAGSSKGSLYFHFSSKKALAQRLVQVWGDVLTDTITHITTTGEPPHQQVAAIYRELAYRVAQDHQVRAGLLMSLEPAVDESAQVYTAWTSAITVIVEHAVRSGDLGTEAAPPRLGESLCAGFVGAMHVASSLGEPESISRRVEDLLALWPGSNQAPARATKAVAR